MSIFSGLAKGLGTAIGGIPGAFIGADIDYAFGQNAAKQQQREQRAFTTMQMKNKYQWQVDDMRKAGLNPYLMYGGASSGAPIAGGTMSMGPVGDASRSISSATDVARLPSEIELNKERANLAAKQALTEIEKALKTKYEGWTENDRRALVQTQKALESARLNISKKELQVKDFDVYWADLKRRILNRIEYASREVGEGAEGKSNWFSDMWNEFWNEAKSVMKAYWDFIFRKMPFGID